MVIDVHDVCALADEIDAGTRRYRQLMEQLRLTLRTEPPNSRAVQKLKRRLEETKQRNEARCRSFGDLTAKHGDEA
jgi:hypothetical protein